MALLLFLNFCSDCFLVRWAAFRWDRLDGVLVADDDDVSGSDESLDMKRDTGPHRIIMDSMRVDVLLPWRMSPPDLVMAVSGDDDVRDDGGGAVSRHDASLACIRARAATAVVGEDERRTLMGLCDCLLLGEDLM